MNWMYVFRALLIAAVLPATAAWAQPQDTAQQKCLQTVNKDGTQVAATQAKANRGCVADAAAGTLAGTARDCLTADASGKVGKKKAKTIADVGKKCVALPDFGFTSADSVNHAAQSSQVGLVADLFGADLDAGLYDCASSEIHCDCQAAVLKAVDALAAVEWKEFLACKKAALKVGKEPFLAGAASAAELGACIDDAAIPGSIAADTKEKIAKKAIKLADVVSDACDTAEITDESFPGACDGLIQAAMSQCLQQRVRCRVCAMLTAMDDLPVDCDAFDDAAANGSCGAVPTPTPTPVATATPTATATLPSAAVGMTAYRPQTEAYGSPFQRRVVADADEESPGAGLRINGDDDDGDSTADRDDSSVSGENDLIEVVLTVGEATPPTGVEYVLRRGNGSLDVWTDASKGTALLDGSDEAVVSFSATSRTVWVESPSGGAADLDFIARTTPGGIVLASDRVHFYPFTSIVVGLFGESQTPSDPPAGLSQAIGVIAVELQQDGYDIHMYDEDDVAADGSGPVYDEVVTAIQTRGVSVVAIYGYSHGGGSTYDLAERLALNAGSIGSFTLPFTGYLDAVENDSNTDLDPEVRIPPTSAYHVNYYQRTALPWGNSVPGSDVNVNVNLTGWGATLNHITIADSITVQNGIHDPLVARVAR